MHTKKVLKGVKPFNELFFRSCYFHQLMTAYSKYGAAAEIIYSNYLPVYRFNEETEQISCKTILLFTEKDTEEYSGLHLVKKKRCFDAVKEIIRAIDRGNPVIVAVDCFELAYREEYYHKGHTGHYLLIYGYDIQKGVFIANEHFYTNSVRYGEVEIKLEVLKKAAESYNDNLALYPSAIVKVTRAPHARSKPIGEEFKRRIVRAAQSLSDSCRSMQKFVAYLKEKSENEAYIIENAERLFADIVNLRREKNNQKYQLAVLLKNDKIDEITARVVDNMIFACGILARISRRKNFRKDIYVDMLDRLEECAAFETELKKELEALQ